MKLTRNLLIVLLVCYFSSNFLVTFSIAQQNPHTDNMKTLCSDGTINTLCSSPARPFYDENENYRWLQPAYNNNHSEIINDLFTDIQSSTSVSLNVTGRVFNCYTFEDATNLYPGLFVNYWVTTKFDSLEIPFEELIGKTITATYSFYGSFNYNGSWPMIISEGHKDGITMGTGDVPNYDTFPNGNCNYTFKLEIMGLNCVNNTVSGAAYFENSPPPPFYLGVQYSSGGTATGNGINCKDNSGTGCYATFDRNASVQLTANPNSGWNFTRWYDSGFDKYLYDNPLTITMNGYMYLRPYFESEEELVLAVSPTNLNVTKEAGTTTISVSNTGTGTMPWTASVISGSEWLMIVSNSSGNNSGTPTCSYTANTGTANRMATIRVTATGATGSPVDVTVIQGAITTDCMATLDSNLSLHIPFLSYLIPYWGAPSYWADLVYEPNPAYPTLIPFKLINAAIIQSGIFSCAASTLSDDLKVHIPDLLYPDGITRMWVDMEYSSVLSTDSQAYFVVTNYGVVSN